MAELSSIFSKKLFPHYKASYFREKSPLQADFPAVQRVGVSLFFGPPEPALTRAASIVPYFAQNFAPKVPSDVQKFRPEILSEKIEKNA